MSKEEIEAAVDRMLGEKSDRMRCKECGHVYELKGDAANPTCPECGSKYAKRADDREESVGRRRPVLFEKADDLLALAGKKKGDDLTLANAKTIGRKVAKMKDAKLKRYLGMMKSLKPPEMRKAAKEAYDKAKPKDKKK